MCYSEKYTFVFCLSEEHFNHQAASANYGSNQESEAKSRPNCIPCSMRANNVIIL